MINSSVYFLLLVCPCVPVSLVSLSVAVFVIFVPVQKNSTPMLTIAGSKMATRVATSLLKAAAADELIVHTLEEYEELAVALATDSERLFQVTNRMHSHVGARKGCGIGCPNLSSR